MLRSPSPYNSQLLKRIGAICSAGALLVGVVGVTISVLSETGAGASTRNVAATASTIDATAKSAASTLSHKTEKIARNFEGAAQKAHTHGEDSHTTVKPAVKPAFATPLFTISVTTTKDETVSTYDTCAATNDHSCSLRAAINEVTTVEASTDPFHLPIVVTVPAGSYHLTDIYATHYSALRVTAPYGIELEGAGEALTTIYGTTTPTNPDHVIEFLSRTTPTTAILDTLTISGGRAPAAHPTNITTTVCRREPYARSGGDLINCGESTTTYLKNVRLTDGHAIHGAAVYASGSMWMTNCTVTGNSADFTYTSTATPITEVAGGGIYLNGYLALSNSTVTHNVVLSSFYATAIGGGIYGSPSSTLLLTGGTVSTNTVTAPTATTTSVAFGGGLADGGAFQIVKTTFSHDSATSGKYLAGGGAIFDNGKMLFARTAIFSTNSVSGDEVGGGAILQFESVIYPGQLPLTLTNDLFETNSVTGIDRGTGAVGGAIAIFNPLIGCEFGASLTHVTLRHNTVQTTGTTFALGGGLLIGGSTACSYNTVTVDNSTISTNFSVATNTEAGGSGLDIAVGASSVSVAHSTIAHNSAVVNSPAYYGIGGGVDVASSGSISITDDTISYNTMTTQGGTSFGAGVFSSGETSTCIFTGDSITHNVANGAGAGIVSENYRLIITSSTVADNVVNGGSFVAAGGGISSNEQLFTLFNSTIATNSMNYFTTTSTSHSIGGGLFTEAVTVAFRFDTITGNKSETEGGLANTIFGNFTMAGTVISGNESLSMSTTGQHFGRPTNCGIGARAVDGGGNYLGISAFFTQQNCLQNPTSTTGTEPMLAPLANNGGNVETMVPEVGSPLLDAGGNSCLPVDEVGHTRPNTNCTVGAFQETVGTSYTSVASDGGVFAFPTQLFHGSTGDLTLNVPIVAMASTPGGEGYWLVARDGGIFAFGNANYYGSLPGAGVSVETVVGIASTPDGKGYWLVGANGGIYAFGDAMYQGSLPGDAVRVSNIVGIAAHGDDGYWLVGANGALYAFGSATYKGGANLLSLNANIVGIASDPGSEGYWLVGSDGGVFGYGSASNKYFGSMGGQHINKPIVGIEATQDGEGYWLVASDGGIFSFGDAHFEGSTGAVTLNKPVVGIG